MSIDIFLRKIWNQNMQWRYLHANYSSSAASYLNTEDGVLIWMHYNLFS
jgi:hypothetical protein